MEDLLGLPKAASGSPDGRKFFCAFQFTVVGICTRVLFTNSRFNLDIS